MFAVSVMSVFKLLSLTVRGLRNRECRRSIFAQYLKSQKANVYFLQEMFSNSRDERVWAAEWGSQIFYSHGSDPSKGVCILIKPSFTLHADIVELDTNRRSVILRLKAKGEATHWERGQFIEFTSLLHIILLLTGDMNSIS